MNQTLVHFGFARPSARERAYGYTNLRPQCHVMRTSFDPQHHHHHHLRRRLRPCHLRPRHRVTGLDCCWVVVTGLLLGCSYRTTMGRSYRTTAGSKLQDYGLPLWVEVTGLPLGRS